MDRDQYIQHLTLEQYPGAKLYVDIVGPLPKDVCRGEEVSYMVTMLDGFTMWAEAIPVASISAEAVAKVIMEQWVTRYGIPDQVHSDQSSSPETCSEGCSGY